MLYALKLAAGLALFFALVPLCIWAGTGSWRHALQGAKEYGQVLAFLCGLPALLAVVVLVAERIG
jgi:hypothetical protein